MTPAQEAARAAARAFAARFAAARRAAGWGFRTALSARTGIEINVLRRIENGQSPTIEQLMLICDALDIAPTDAIGVLHTPDVLTRTQHRRSSSEEWRFVSDEATLINPVEQRIEEGQYDAAVRHDGTEWIYVVDGMVELELGGGRTRKILREHHTIEFDASVPHRFIAGIDGAVILRRMSRTGLELHLRRLDDARAPGEPVWDETWGPFDAR